MNQTELYEKAIRGDFYAFEELRSQAVANNAESQYLLYCVCDNISSPFRDVETGMTWLKKSAENGYEDAQKAYNGLTPQERVKYHIEKEGDINEVYGSLKSGGMWSFEGRMGRATYAAYVFSYFLFFLGAGVFFFFCI